jgi:hypothetical protein
MYTVPSAPIAGDVHIGPFVNVHFRCPFAVLSATSLPFCEATYTVAPSADSAGPELTVPPSEKDHFGLPFVGLSALTTLALPAVGMYTVPSSPIAGEAPVPMPGATDHFVVPVELIALNRRVDPA